MRLSLWCAIKQRELFHDYSDTLCDPLLPVDEGLITGLNERVLRLDVTAHPKRSRLGQSSYPATRLAQLHVIWCLASILAAV